MAEKFLTQEQLSVFCSSLAMLLRSGASLSEVSSLFEEDGMDTALRQASTEISLSVAAGETFSAAAEKTGVFPEYALSVFSTAESFPADWTKRLTALQTTMTAKARYTTVCAAPLHTRPF